MVECAGHALVDAAPHVQEQTLDLVDETGVADLGVRHEGTADQRFHELAEGQLAHGLFLAFSGLR